MIAEPQRTHTETHTHTHTHAHAHTRKVCDVIAEPQRVPQLLEAWCQGEWAQADILKS